MEDIGKVHEVEKEIEWRIGDFVPLPEEEEKRYFSPNFSFAEEFWYLKIYPNGQSEYNSLGHIDLYLHRYSDGPPVSVTFSFALKTTNGKKYHEKQQTWDFKRNEGQGWSRFLKRSTLSEEKSRLLPSDTLTIVCFLQCATSPGDAGDTSLTKCTHCKDDVEAKDMPTHERKCLNKPIKCPECSEVVALKKWLDHECKLLKGDTSTTKCAHCKDIVEAKDMPNHEKKCLNKPIKCPECSEVVVLKNWHDHECQLLTPKDEPGTSATPTVLHENKVLDRIKRSIEILKSQNCDVVIKVQGKEFTAHKAILEDRSSVFASNFRHDMKEKATGVVEIEDCEATSFAGFLDFLYCAEEAVITPETVFGLFTAADKYDIQDLREKCLEFMKQNISVDTFCDTITLAIRHSESELINLATDFFVMNAPKIILTVKWQLFLEENPTQSNELFVKLLVNNETSSK